MDYTYWNSKIDEFYRTETVRPINFTNGDGETVERSFGLVRLKQI